MVFVLVNVVVVSLVVAIAVGTIDSFFRCGCGFMFSNLGKIHFVEQRHGDPREAFYHFRSSIKNRNGVLGQVLDFM